MVAAGRRRFATAAAPSLPPGGGAGNVFPISRGATTAAGLWRSCPPRPRSGAPTAATAPARAASGGAGASAGAEHGGTSCGWTPLPGSTTAATATPLTATFPGYAPPGTGGGFTLTTNDLARLTAGAVRATAPGGTSILATVATAPAGGHLAVDYRERAWARGRIPGSFLRREMGPSDRECLASRLIDRSLRPLLPAATGGVHVTATLVAGDIGQTEPADVLALTAASAAVEVALGVGGGGPGWRGPVGAVRLGRVGGDGEGGGGDWVVNPGRPDDAGGRGGARDPGWRVFVAATDTAIMTVSVEGVTPGHDAAAALPEADLLDAVALGHAAIRAALPVQRAAAEAVWARRRDVEGVAAFPRRLPVLPPRVGGGGDGGSGGSAGGDPPATVRDPAAAADMVAAVQAASKAAYLDAYTAGAAAPGKASRAAAVTAATDSIYASVGSAHPTAPADLLTAAIGAGARDAFRSFVLDGPTRGRRLDGRGATEVRPITATTGLFPGPASAVHGSALFCRGDTQTLSAATLGLPASSQRIDGYLAGGDGARRGFMVHYAFPPACVGEVGRPGGMTGGSRRELGHAALTETALAGVMPPWAGDVERRAGGHDLDSLRREAAAADAAATARPAGGLRGLGAQLAAVSERLDRMSTLLDATQEDRPGKRDGDEEPGSPVSMTPGSGGGETPPGSPRHADVGGGGVDGQSAPPSSPLVDVPPTPTGQRLVPALARSTVPPPLPPPSTEPPFPYAVRLTTEVLASDGSTSMASVCGGTLALLDAGVPLAEPVVGVAIGLVARSPEVLATAPAGTPAAEDYVVLTDIVGAEDHLGDMDLKVAGPAGGVTALQLDVKLPHGLPLRVLAAALTRARAGREAILETLAPALAAARARGAAVAAASDGGGGGGAGGEDDAAAVAAARRRPTVSSLPLSGVQREFLLSAGGANIKRLAATTGVRLTVVGGAPAGVGGGNGSVDGGSGGDGGVLTLEAEGDDTTDGPALVRSLLAGVEGRTAVGRAYTGVVERVVSFGAFVRVAPDLVGLLHVSTMKERERPDAFVDVTSLYAVGDAVEVVVAGTNERGRLSFSLPRRPA